METDLNKELEEKILFEIKELQTQLNHLKYDIWAITGHLKALIDTSLIIENIIDSKKLKISMNNKNSYGMKVLEEMINKN